MCHYEGSTRTKVAIVGFFGLHECKVLRVDTYMCRWREGDNTRNYLNGRGRETHEAQNGEKEVEIDLTHFVPTCTIFFVKRKLCFHHCIKCRGFFSLLEYSQSLYSRLGL